MQVKNEFVGPTTVKLVVSADPKELEALKSTVVKRLSQNLKLPGFRAGKAPQNMIEKNLDQNLLQSEFLEEAINHLYAEAAGQERVRPVDQPKITLKKFVPFTTLDFEAEVEAVGEIKLPDYKKIKLAKSSVTVTDKDIEGVMANLKTRAAEKQEVKRASQDEDQVWIDFSGRDAKTKEPVKGADGKDYPLLLGSNTFIPGFEANIVGMKAGESKEFTLKFPKDYSVKALQNRQVNFEVKVSKVEKVVEPKVDDAFAAKVGPFKTVAELKADIKRQLQTERQAEAERDFENQLLYQIAEKSTVAIPASLVEEEIDRIEQDERQNLAYRGQTWQEYLAEEGLTEEEHREKNRQPAETRVKAGLVLAAIAESEKVTVEPEELEIRLQLMKGQYQDPAMLAELEKPEARRSIISRLLSEKTLARLKEYAGA